MGDSSNLRAQDTTWAPPTLTRIGPRIVVTISAIKVVTNRRLKTCTGGMLVVQPKCLLFIQNLVVTLGITSGQRTMMDTAHGNHHIDVLLAVPVSFCPF